MIFQRSLLREFTATGIATFFVLLAITITTQLIRFLGYAARGQHFVRCGADLPWLRQPQISAALAFHHAVHLGTDDPHP